MNFVEPNVKETDPFLQLLLLFLYAIAGAVVFTFIAIGVVFIMYGSELIQNLSLLLNGDTRYLDGFKIIQIFSSVGTFIVPPLFLAYTQRRKVWHYYDFNKPAGKLLLLVFLVMIFSMPFMEFTALMNQKMALPGFLKSVEQWMKEKEAVAAELTIRLITVRSNFDLLVNLFMIAVIPAIGEELMFRAGIQGIFKRMFGNIHVAIWLSAILFSAIHMQFYGFVPRMLLGAGFGYLYYFGGSIWYAILAHFINNAYAVFAAFYMQKHNMPLDQADQPVGFHWYGYLISAIITIALFQFFKQTASRERKLG